MPPMRWSANSVKTTRWYSASLSILAAWNTSSGVPWKPDATRLSTWKLWLRAQIVCMAVRETFSFARPSPATKWSRRLTKGFVSRSRAFPLPMKSAAMALTMPGSNAPVTGSIRAPGA